MIGGKRRTCTQPACAGHSVSSGRRFACSVHFPEFIPVRERADKHSTFIVHTRCIHSRSATFWRSNKNSHPIRLSPNHHVSSVRPVSPDCLLQKGFQPTTKTTKSVLFGTAASDGVRVVLDCRNGHSPARRLYPTATQRRLLSVAGRTEIDGGSVK